MQKRCTAVPSYLCCPFRNAFLIILACGLAPPLDAASPSVVEELKSQSAECLQLAEDSILDFYLPGCIDKKNGGYLENLGQDGKFTSGGGKFLTLQARQIWTFSTFAERGIRKAEALAAAKHGFDYLQEHFYDKQSGGYFNQLNDDGSVRDENKHAYLNSFVIYAFVAYHRASGDQAAIKAALELFDLLEAKAYDKLNGGYQEYFYRDWRPITDPSVNGIVGGVGTKTYNTHLHLLESFTELYRTTGEPRVRSRLSELMSINTVTVQHKKYPCNIDGWSLEWEILNNPNNLKASYGHDVECAWLVLDAAKALGWPEFQLRSWCVKVVDYSMQHGYDSQHGGFYYTGPLGEKATDQHKEWWVQAEALVCMLDMYRLTKDTKYLEAFETTFAFVKNHQIASEGGWWAARQADGSPSPNKSRTSMWQGGYHAGRAMLRCADLLQQIANNP